MYSVSPVSGAAAALTHLTSPAYTPLSPDAMGRTSPLQTPGSSPAYVPEDGASPYVTEAGSPASPKGFLPASPEIREQDLASPDMDDMYTSPSYTPHDYPEAAPEPSAAAGETLVSVHESYEPSQLFEHSDDEADNEPSTVEQPQLPLASDSGRVHSPTSPGE
mmetsp:Transcript_45193/g.127938  ORF Transcript_45193/g.127938 Transcript_45193/m.127938 type:complete len:163 (+) Transcript_45193:116-604(+)